MMTTGELNMLLTLLFHMVEILIWKVQKFKFFKISENVINQSTLSKVLLTINSVKFC